MFYAWTTGPEIPTSIDIDNNTGLAYVFGDMGQGEIWRIDTATREGASLFGPAATLSQDTNYCTESQIPQTSLVSPLVLLVEVMMVYGDQQ
mmetsp:Transcript_14242/g.21279  ORF Transcript_14242/g.21279 Transcript_14242/m.21279 type:complete len:91 (+) Transcript_14242:511-783(+)